MEAEPRVTLAYFQAYPLEAAKQLETWTTTDIATVLAATSRDASACSLLIV